MSKSTRGFTIVELLIVIVVIAILAAITIVAYNGIQNRAHDTSVKTDLSMIQKKIQLWKVSNAESMPGYIPYRTDMGIVVNQSSYKTTGTAYNLLYCSFGGEYVVLATSRSENKFILKSSGGVEEYTGSTSWTGTNHATQCSDALPGSVSNGAGYYAADAERWKPWVKTP